MDDAVGDVIGVVDGKPWLPPWVIIHPAIISGTQPCVQNTFLWSPPLWSVTWWTGYVVDGLRGGRVTWWMGDVVDV